MLKRGRGVEIKESDLWVSLSSLYSNFAFVRLLV